MEEEGYRVAQRLDDRQQAAHGKAAGDEVGYRKGDAEVHEGEGQGLEHGAPRVRIILH